MFNLDARQLTPYLTMHDTRAALDFYGKVFGATWDEPMMAEDGKRIMHVTAHVAGQPLMMSDAFPEFGNVEGPDKQRGSPVCISLQLQKPEDIDALYEKALAHGAEGTSPPEDMFWGDRFAQFADPQGHRWMLTALLPKTGS
ncbi:MAG: glyoxalase/bleomycin resistance/extradiol dioxygenase family protein [Pseudomonadota bacterium]